MNSKVIVKIIVPEIDQVFDMYLPVNKKIGNIIELISKAINELTTGEYTVSNTTVLVNVETDIEYEPDILLLNTDIRNGTKLVLISE